MLHKNTLLPTSAMASKKKAVNASDPTPDPAHTAGWVAPKTTTNSYSLNSRTLYPVNTRLSLSTTHTATPGYPGPKDTTPVAANIEAK